MVEILREALSTSLVTICRLAIILMPLMIVLEYAKHFNVLEKLTKYLGWLPRGLGISEQAVFPLLVGMIVGITYGAAVIIDYARQGTISKRDMTLVGIFLAVNHSVVEDNLLFASLGASLLVLLPLRFLFAFLLTRAVAMIAKVDEAELETEAAPQK
ncbi:MAG TPA: nucleoside recognition protein [Oscillospiraceae bacterium]|nr:nucleoside recognition protein [Oscillospiraceae bacterium]